MIQLIYMTAVVCLKLQQLRFSIIGDAVTATFIFRIEQCLSKQWRQYIHTQYQYVSPKLYAVTLQKPKTIVFWTNCKCKVTLSGNARMQPSR